MRDYAKRWNAVGFRSPATQRHWELMPMLGFDYDSSYSDTDPYEPQPGGCCTCLPYFNQEMVELPITNGAGPYSLRDTPESGRKRMAAEGALLRERRGMVLVLTHPDYAHDRRIADGYRQLLDEFAGDDTVWHALRGRSRPGGATAPRRRSAAVMMDGGSRDPRRPTGEWGSRRREQPRDELTGQYALASHEASAA